MAREQDMKRTRQKHNSGSTLWSPPAHNAGIVWVSAPGGYATFNSNHTPDGTRQYVFSSCWPRSISISDLGRNWQARENPTVDESIGLHTDCQAARF